MVDTSKQGTGDTFVEFEGPNGECVEIKDDGDSDPHVRVFIDGQRGSLKAIRTLRASFGDDYVEDVLQRAFGDGADSDDGIGPLSTTPGAEFKTIGGHEVAPTDHEEPWANYGCRVCNKICSQESSFRYRECVDD